MMPNGSPLIHHAASSWWASHGTHGGINQPDGRFETEVLTQPGNLKALTNLSGKWIDRLRERQPMRN